MKFNTLFLIFALLVACASALAPPFGPSFGPFKGCPSCAVKCFREFFPISGCEKQTDLDCLCNSKPLKTKLVDCVPKKCNLFDMLKAKEWVKKKCKGHYKAPKPKPPMPE